MKRFLFVLIILIAIVLRFYNLSGYIQFLGDQGRDVLIVKRMLVEHQWTLLGPNASVGGFFTGPIYYYFMLPFLWFFNLNPVGPAYLSAFFGLATVILIYYFCKHFFNERVALVASFLSAISPKMVDISRFSWNPNPVPFFSLLAVLFLYLSATKHKKIFTVLSGVMVGILFQLHYIDIVFIAISGVSLLLLFPWKEWVKQIFLIVLGFIIGDGLFLAFEIRHGFPNFVSMWEFITRKGQTVAPRSLNFLWLYDDITRRLYEMLFYFQGWPLKPFLYFSLLAALLWAKSTWFTHRAKVIVIGAWYLIGIFGIGSYQGDLHDHYFVYLYPLPFIFVGLLAENFLKNKFLKYLVLPGIALIIYFSVKNAFFWQEPHNMFQQVKEIDEQVLFYANGQPYNLALISGYNSDFAYRYFLEVWKKPPITIENPDKDPERTTVTSQLMVICEEKKCEPLGHPLWEIAGFGRAVILDQTTGPAGIKIFKLVHYEQTQNPNFKF